ncbi:hypothetical protein GCM10010885_21530 [Alicyclobacillus cellulosilyticus]|uniref:Alpha-L-rhamnosidase-like protein n=1 Tax=Alicyclobacillus cellulosilyticus TaxID=1003997 RepID=A0A917NMJ8_9BACL|nr:glycosyl hydrolase [Alicyclobacillus cellulosilyticus]GGJ11890.1 hypothetical protein GCM10010885_21530 [Alicyclobacillus cellulosilyticus]
MRDLARQFLDPDRSFSIVPLWFWFGRLRKEELIRQVDEMVDKGVYGAFMHARPYLLTPYLEEEWWDVVGGVVDHAARVGFQAWLYDEYAWPSGTAGSVFKHGHQAPSRILALGRQHMAQGLAMREAEWTGPARVRVFLPGIPDTRQAALLVRVVERDHLDDAACREARDGQPSDPCQTGGGSAARTLVAAADVWDVSGQWGDTVELPPGRWRLMVFFTYEVSNMINYLNPETVQRFIQVTHEAYRQRVGRHFGTTIPGIFFDEIFNAGHPLVWTDGFAEEFALRVGYEIRPKLPLLIYDGDDKVLTYAVRRDYFAVLAQLYEEAFFRQISAWCTRHGLWLTGHTEEALHAHPLRQGDYFATQRHLHIPGADCHDYRYRYPRTITFVEPKGAVSVARLYGKPRVLSEALGGGGWATTLQEFKRGIHVLAAMGINFFALHGFYSEIDHQGSQADWPASFFFQNPHWKYFKIFADHVRRISYMGTIGKPVCPVGIVYPIRAMWEHTAGGRVDDTGLRIDQQYHALLNHLLSNQVDADLVDEASIQAAEVDGGRLRRGDASFAVLFVHKCQPLDSRTCDKLRTFAAAGGTVVLYGAGPPEPEAALLADLAPCVDAGEDPKVWLSIARQYEGHTLEVVAGEAEGFYAYCREYEGCRYYFLVNAMDRAKSLVIDFHALGAPQLWDPETGSQLLLPVLARWPEAKKTRLALTLHEDQAVYVVFRVC